MTVETPADIEHTTSSGLQIVQVHDGNDIAWVLIDRNTRHTFPIDETQWRELQSFIIAVHGIEGKV